METRTAQANFTALLQCALERSRSAAHPRDLAWPDVYPRCSDGKVTSISKHSRCEDQWIGHCNEGQALASHKLPPRPTQSPDAHFPGFQNTNNYHGDCDTEVNGTHMLYGTTSPDTCPAIRPLAAVTFDSSTAVLSRLQASTAALRIQVRLAVSQVLGQAVALNSAGVLYHSLQTTNESINALENSSAYSAWPAPLKQSARRTC